MAPKNVSYNNGNDDGSQMSSSDVETFNGKIVYNLDGSAYIIAADNANGCGSGSAQCYAPTCASIGKLSKVKDRGQGEKEKEQHHQHHQEQSEKEGREDSVGAGPGLEALSGAIYKSSPKVHSFRVVSAQDANSTCQDQIKAFKIQKPILMCFICKLSFGNVKSFSLHANIEHRLNLEELDQQLLNREYSSAIIQRNMDEKPQISFLQPLDHNVTCAANDNTEQLQITPEVSGVAKSSSPQPGLGNEDDLELEKKQETEPVRTLEQDLEHEPETNQDTSRSKMAAPSAYLPSSSPKVAVKSTVKFCSLNSETAKTNNLSKVSSTSSPTSTYTSGEVSLPSTDNISINKLTNFNQGIEPPSSSSSEIEMKTGSMSTSPQTNDSDFVQLQHVATGGIHPSQVTSFHASLAALAANDSNDNRVKLITEFIQQQLQQHQQNSSIIPSQCPDHPDPNGDCKTCELLDIHKRLKSPPSSHCHLSQSLPQLQVQSQPQQIPHRSPCNNSVGLAISPSASSVTSVGNASSATSSFTIGACSEHINGRPQGVDCARCEMLLSSARLNSGVQMSTRNSCKTLKCPQCNWHYKYQETLEIHMREKHPDGESACGYCLADITVEAGFNLTRTLSKDAFSDTSNSVPSSATVVPAILNASIISPTSSLNFATPGEKTEESTLSTTVFKCKLCEYFVQSKSDIASHIETEHPNADSDDFISIPTNTAALQAFQTAVAAAALAAVQQRCGTINAPTQDTVDAGNDTNIRDGPLAIKKERLDEDDSMAVTEDIKEVTSQILASVAPESPKDQESPVGVQCPLCLENHFREKQYLENHLASVHSVTRDGLSRLLLLVDQKAWKKESETTNIPDIKPQTLYPTTSTDEGKPLSNEGSSSANTIKVSTASSTSLPVGMQGLGLSCQQCEASFKHEEQLLQHAQQNKHFSLQNGEYLCLATSHISRPCYMTFKTISAMITHFQESHMSLVISERHVYKYRCKQCSLAFKTQDKLTTHMLYHTMRDATKCALCQRNFRSTQALQKHMELAHSEDGVPLDRQNSPQLPTLIAEDTHNLSLAETNEKEVTGNDFESELSKETRHLSPSPMSLDSQSQQQYLATFAALLKQQQQCNSDAVGKHPEDFSLSAGEFSQHLQGLQNLQHFQHMQQQFGAVAAASGLPINPVDMLNLMQFHHLMSLNFMNLAPPLVFGANAAGSSAIPASSMQNNIITSSSTVASAPGLSDVQIGSGINALPGDSAKATIVSAQSQHNANSNSQLASNQKRARTRITDDQLKILRAHFDINNSPSEESIMEMSQKSNLPMKVVKHWFRNTLFKERQRNKDSPYNFNNPPSTTLNLEEYERTGQAKVTPLNDTSSAAIANSISTSTMSSAPSANLNLTSKESITSKIPASGKAIATAPVSYPATVPSSTPVSRPESTNSSGNTSDYLSNNLFFGQTGGKEQGLPYAVEGQIKSEPQDDMTGATDFVFQAKQLSNFNFLKHQQELMDHQEQSITNQESEMSQDQSLLASSSLSVHCQNQQQNNVFETKSESGSSDVMSRPPTPNSGTAGNIYGTMNDLINQQLENIGNNMGPPKKLQIVAKPFDKNSTPTSSSIGSNTQFECNSSNSSSSSSTSGGKRANRTRFTDYQIKVLQEFFENNSYPKDSDLEYLSKLLLLSPRVIVVWFQNARQKQRKIYENQPNNSLFENEETKKQNINYACKKCSLVFQRYYELIRHQKNHCFKEENNKKSAKAQIAAAQIAHNLSSEDSNSSMDIHNVSSGMPGITVVSQSVSTTGSAAGQYAQQTFGASPSPQHSFAKSSSLTDFSPSTTPTPPQRERSNSLDHPQRPSKLDCDKCELQFSQLEKLREHQLVHLMSPANIFSDASHNPNPDDSFGPFGSILQSLQQAAAQHQQPPKKKKKIL